MKLPFRGSIVSRCPALTCSLVLLGLLTSGCGYLEFLNWTGNIHAVVPAKCYRSAQLSPTQIEACARQYGIRTIINLRGRNTGSTWYDDEVNAAKTLGIDHIDFRMSASSELSKTEADNLISMMRRARGPLLIHCRSGADRTGLASALYLAAIQHAGRSSSEGALSIRYGHFSLPFISEYAMDRTLQKLEPSLEFDSK